MSKINNYVLFDTYDFNLIDRGMSYRFDKVNIIESLLFHDKLFITATEQTIGEVINSLVTCVGQATFLRLLEDNLLKFVIDNSSYKISNKNNLRMRLGEFSLEPIQNDIEKSIKEEVDASLHRKVIRYLRNHSKQVNINNLLPNHYKGNIVNNLNDKELLTQFIHTSTWRDASIIPNYRVYSENDGIYVEVESIDEEIKKQMFTYVGIYGLNCLRTECFKYIATQTNVNNLHGNTCTQAILEKGFRTSNLASNQLGTILEIENMPNMSELVKRNYIEIDNVLSLRKKTTKVRKFLATLDSADPTEIRLSYLEAIQGKETLFDTRLFKNLRFIIPTVVGVVNTPSGVVLASADYFISTFLDNKSKSIRLSDIIDTKPSKLDSI